MKQLLFLSYILMCFCSLINAQDLIIRTNGDTVKCLVTKIDSNIIYFKIGNSRKAPTTYLSKDKIKVYNVPVLPDDPARVLYERKIKNATIWATISGVVFLTGGIFEITGIAQVSKTGGDVNMSPNGVSVTQDANSDEKGVDRMAAGFPLLVAGGIIGSISLHTIHKYQKKLKILYNMSISLDNNSDYNNIHLTYKF
jgi:hypothetical protein